MPYHSYAIEHFGKDSDGSYSSTATLITDVISINLGFGLGERADSFSFTQSNYDNERLEQIKIDDRVKLYSNFTGTTTLLMDGLVNEKQSSADTSSRVITFSGLNRLEKLFNALVSTTGEPVQRPASEWITNIIDQVNEFNQLGGTNRTITYDGSSIATTTTKISFVRGYERAFKLIEELSQPEMTDGDSYIYYVDENNKFFWQPRPTATTSTLTWATDSLKHRTKKGMFDIVNYIIMNAGKSPYGATILEFDYDVESINKYGWKVKLVTQEDIANELYTADRKSKPDRWDDDNSFPDFTGGDYLTIWGVSTSSDATYNTAFVSAVQSIALQRIRGFLLKKAGASFKTNLKINPQVGFGLGNNHKLIIPSNNWDDASTGHTSRLVGVNYGFTKDGWTTDIKFEDDSEFTRTT